MSLGQELLMQVLYNLVGMSALPVGVHHNDASLPDKPFQSVFDPDCGEGRIRIAGHDIPENELEAEVAGHVDRVVVELPVGRAKQCGFMTVLGFEQTNRSENFLFLLID